MPNTGKEGGLDAFALIAERRILQAMEEGAFDNLEGSGRPLDFSSERRIPRELRAVYRLLKNAGFLPPELELRSEIRRLEDLLPTIRQEEALLAAVRDVNEKITLYNIVVGRSRGRTISAEMAQHYAGKLVERLGTRDHG